MDKTMSCMFSVGMNRTSAIISLERTPWRCFRIAKKVISIGITNLSLELIRIQSCFGGTAWMVVLVLIDLARLEAFHEPTSAPVCWQAAGSNDW